MELTYIPDGLSGLSFWVLVILSCFTSMLTASIGIGGGTLMLAVMAQVIPIRALVPVHGVVQLGSNFGRAMIMRSNINKSLFSWFLIGSLFGAILGGAVVVSLPAELLKGILGCFILYSVWGAGITSFGASNPGLLVGGFLSTLLTMFVGATGPFVVAFLRAFNLSPPELVATSAACLLAQHSLKVFVFAYVGFIFSAYIPLIAMMVASGFIGTLIGRKILLKIDPNSFKKGLNIVLTVLALKLLFDAV